MKIGRLLQLARQDNPVLAEYVKMWMDVKWDGSSSRKEEKDPVTLAIAWRKNLRTHQKWLVLALACVALPFVMEWAIGVPSSPVLQTIEGWWFCLAVLGSVFLTKKVMSIACHKSDDTQKFLEVITKLECVWVVTAGRALGAFPENPLWSRVGEVKNLVLECLCNQAAKIENLQNSTPSLWRTEEVKEKLKRMRNEFGSNHHLFRKLLDIPEFWEHYFKNSSSARQQ